MQLIIAYSVVLIVVSSMPQEGEKIPFDAIPTTNSDFETPAEIGEIDTSLTTRSSIEGPEGDGEFDIIPIISSSKEGPAENGTYSFHFETGDGIERSESGAPSEPAGPVIVHGNWSFTFPDGTPAEFTFTADENGYRVESPLIPETPAHTHEQIARGEREKSEAIAREARKVEYEIIPIVSSHQEGPSGDGTSHQEGPSGDGTYSFDFETGDGVKRSESGGPSGTNGSLVVKGSWSFTFPDGTPAEFTFTADENGFIVQSDLIPEIPSHALEQIARSERERAAGIVHDGQWDPNRYAR